MSGTNQLRKIIIPLLELQSHSIYGGTGGSLSASHAWADFHFRISYFCLFGSEFRCFAKLNIFPTVNIDRPVGSVLGKKWQKK